MSGYNHFLRCPHCGKVYSISSSGNSKELTRYLGQTLDKCPKCKREILNLQYVEWECLDNTEKRFYLATKLDNNLVYNAKQLKQAKIDAGMTILIPIIGWINSGSIIRLVNKFNNYQYDPSDIKNDVEIQNSIKRTKNPEYRKMLLNAGFYFYGVEYKDE